MKFENIEQGVDYVFLTIDGWRIVRAKTLTSSCWVFDVVNTMWSFNLYDDKELEKLKPLIFIDDLVAL